MQRNEFDWDKDENIPDHAEICPNCKTLYTSITNGIEKLEKCQICGFDFDSDDAPSVGAFGGNDTPRWNAPKGRKSKCDKSPFDVKIIEI